jgi:hypothetical protein
VAEPDLDRGDIDGPLEDVLALVGARCDRAEGLELVEGAFVTRLPVAVIGVAARAGIFRMAVSMSSVIVMLTEYWSRRPGAVSQFRKSWCCRRSRCGSQQAPCDGPRTAGMEGVYAHVAPETRATLIAADEHDWYASLQAWFTLNSASPVPVLDALLVPQGETKSQVKSQ